MSFKAWAKKKENYQFISEQKKEAEKQKLNEALKTLKAAGALITEDTDDWDGDDLGLDLDDREREDTAWRHNLRRRMPRPEGDYSDASFLSHRYVDAEKFGSMADRAWTRAIAANEEEKQSYKYIEELESELKRTKKPAKRKELESRIKWYKDRLKNSGKDEERWKNQNLEREDVLFIVGAVEKILNKELRKDGEEYAKMQKTNFFENRWWIHVKHAVEEVLEGPEGASWDQNPDKKHQKWKANLNPDVDFQFGDPNDIAKQIKDKVWELLKKRYDDWTYGKLED